jgi:hypothetical protein
MRHTSILISVAAKIMEVNLANNSPTSHPKGCRDGWVQVSARDTSGGVDEHHQSKPVSKSRTAKS